MGGLGPVACFFRVRGAREKISVILLVENGNLENMY